MQFFLSCINNAGYVQNTYPVFLFPSYNSLNYAFNDKANQVGIMISVRQRYEPHTNSKYPADGQRLLNYAFNDKENKMDIMISVRQR